MNKEWVFRGQGIPIVSDLGAVWHRIRRVGRVPILGTKATDNSYG